jgi:hypothetical protein
MGGSGIHGTRPVGLCDSPFLGKAAFHLHVPKDLELDFYVMFDSHLIHNISPPPGLAI